MGQKSKICNMFGGEDALGQNALMSALQHAAGSEDTGDIYKFMENTPKTSFVVFVHDALRDLGYKIVQA